MMISIETIPNSALVDDPLKIQICGLEPREDVTLFAVLEENGMSFISSACFVADYDGKIDVSEAVSLSGTYTGVYSTGIIWSMIQAPGQRSGLRLLKRDVTTPYTISLSLHKHHITTEQCLRDKNVMATSEFERLYKDRNVTRTPVRHGRIRGTLFVPPGRGPHPGVIDLFGAAGGLIEHRAALLASRGFTTLALAYFNFEDLPTTILDMNLDYFAEAVEWFSSLPVVAGKQIGISSVSFGSIIALQLSTLIPNIKAIVCIGTPYFRCFSNLYYKGSAIEGDSSGIDPTLAVLSDKGIIMRDCMKWNPKEETMIKLEESNAQFLFIQGSDDQNVHPRCLDELANRFKSHNKSNYTAILYPGAGHLIEPPHMPLCSVCFVGLVGSNVVYGGQPVEHAISQQDSWTSILRFFKLHLPQHIASQELNHKL